MIASDIPENREVLPDQALFFKSGDADDLRQKLAWALDNPGQMALMAGQARTWVEANYRWPGIIAGYEQLYDELMGVAARTPAALTPTVAPEPEHETFLGNSSRT
jgi:glycosyltransferase involved in cell wall biosynthesis